MAGWIECELSLGRRKIIGVEAIDDLVEGVADFSGQRQELEREAVAGLTHDVGAVADIDQFVMHLEFHRDIDFIADLNGTGVCEDTQAARAPVKNREGDTINNADTFIGITAWERTARGIIFAAAIVADGIKTESCFDLVEHAR